MSNQSVIIGGKEIPLVTPKSDLTISSRQPGGKYHAGNTPWWQPTDLMAFDSSIFSPVNNVFADHNGLPIEAGRNAFGTTGGSYPYLAGEVGFEYGEGIRLPDNSFVASVVGELSGSIIADSYTFDFWMKETSLNAGGRPALYTILTYADIQATSGTAVWNNRYIFAPGIGGASNAAVTAMSLWNNAQNPRVNGAWPHDLVGTDWKHVAVVYNKGLARTYLYVNGIQKGYLAWAALPVTGNCQTGIVNFAGPSQHPIVERVRLRAGIHFTGTSIDLNSIYPNQ